MTTTDRRRGSGRTRSGARSGRATGRGRAIRSGSAHPRTPSRRRARARRFVALLIVLGLLGGGYALFFSPLLGVRTVEVTGAKGLSAQQVREAAGVPMGHPMLRLDTDELSRRVLDELPGAAAAEVSRSWPSTVRIAVRERVPVAVFRASDGMRLVDAEAADFPPAGKVPRGLPELTLSRFDAADPASAAAVRSLMSLPGSMRRQVVSVAADTPGSVEFTMRNKRLVRWGDAMDGRRKAAVLQALLQQRGKVFDVSSPDLPTVS